MIIEKNIATLFQFLAIIGVKHIFAKLFHIDVCKP